MGERGLDVEPPTDDDLAEMQRLTAEAVRAGALGVTTSRAFAHRFRSGKPAPSVKTEDLELLALARGLRDAGTGVFQIIPSYDVDVDKRFELLRALAVELGRPVSFTFVQAVRTDDDWQRMLARITEANADGLPIRGQVLPRPTATLLGLDLSYHPFSLNPSYRPLADLPLEEKVNRLRTDDELHRNLLAEEPDDPNPFFRFVVSDLESLYVLGDPPNDHPRREDSIAARARATGVDPRSLISTRCSRTAAGRSSTDRSATRSANGS